MLFGKANERPRQPAPAVAPAPPPAPAIGRPSEIEPARVEPTPTPADLAAEAERKSKEAAEHEERINQTEERERHRQAAELDPKLARKLKLGKALEVINPRAALDYYREVIELAPDSSRAKTARERIKALGEVR